MADSFSYSRESHRFRDVSTGRYISQARVQAARDTFLAQRRETMRAITAPMTAGTLSVQEWNRQMRAAIVENHLAQSMLGKGGRANMTQADWGRAGRAIRTELQFLGKFAGEAAAGRLSPAQAEARAAMYGASTAPYARAVAADWGITFPCLPGDGKTACRSNCACDWVLDEDDDEIRATWTISAAESCDGCLDRAALYDPFRIAKAKQEAA